MAKTTPRTLTVGVRAFDAMAKDELEIARRIDAGGGYQGEACYFETMPLLFEVFSAKRWELIQVLQDTGPSSLRGLARALGRDVKRVHEDAAVLLAEGIIERNEKNELFVPYATIRLEAELKTREIAA